MVMSIGAKVRKIDFLKAINGKEVRIKYDKLLNKLIFYPKNPIYIDCEIGSMYCVGNSNLKMKFCSENPYEYELLSHKSISENDVLFPLIWFAFGEIFLNGIYDSGNQLYILNKDKMDKINETSAIIYFSGETMDDIEIKDISIIECHWDDY